MNFVLLVLKFDFCCIEASLVSQMVKNLPANAGLGRSPGEENDYPLQYSCLGNSVDRGARQVHGIKKSHT